MNIQHSAANDSWRTPDHIISLVHRVIGHPDLDPASCPEANELIRANQILTRADNALEAPWPRSGDLSGLSVYLNPPGGKIGNRSVVRLFWQRLMDYRRRGGLSHAIFALFSIEGLQTTQADIPAAIQFPICVPAKRVRWVHPGSPKKSPTHSNAFVYVPGTIDETDKFIEVFTELGRCKP